MSGQLVVSMTEHDAVGQNDSSSIAIRNEGPADRSRQTMRWTPGFRRGAAVVPERPVGEPWPVGATRPTSAGTTSTQRPLPHGTCNRRSPGSCPVETVQTAVP